jgi:hypothetical protein
MTDIVITAASVIAGDNAIVESGTAGATITAGQAVYREAATNKFKLADNNSATAEVRLPRGIALNGASNGQPLSIVKSGPVTIGGTMTPNVAYYLGDTPGGICPVADLILPVATGEYPTIIGMATSTTVLDVDIQTSGGAL